MLNAKSSVFCHALRLMAFISSRLVYNSLLAWTLWKLGKCEDQTWWLENSDRPTSCGMEHSHKHNALSLILSLSQVQVNESKNILDQRTSMTGQFCLKSLPPKSESKYMLLLLLPLKIAGKSKACHNIDRDTDCVCISLWVWACVCVYV